MIHAYSVVEYDMHDFIRLVSTKQLLLRFFVKYKLVLSREVPTTNALFAPTISVNVLTALRKNTLRLARYFF